MNRKKKLVIILEIIIAVFFVIGADYVSDTFHRLFHSYFADIFIPLGFYFLLKLAEDKYDALKKWSVKALAVFVLCAVSETLQYFGIFALARVFDPVDYLMYGTGALLAVVLDRLVFKHIFNFWD